MGDIPKKEWKEAYLISTGKISILETRIKNTEKKLKKAVKFIKEVQEYFKPPQDTHSTMIGIDELLESLTPTREK